MEMIDDAIIGLDYYYPHTQSPLCLHGTLAAGYLYFKKNAEKTRVTVVTKNQQYIEIEKINNDIFLIVSQQACPEVKISPAFIQKLLDLDKIDAIVQINIASVGSPKLLVEVDSKTVLDNLSPDLDMIYKWGTENNVRGCYVYFKADNLNIHGRNFNHLESKFEDSATGVAAGALSSLFKSDLRIHQGHNLGNPCLVSTRYSQGKIFIGGNVSEFDV
jgi:PhzF family phenazine biosynthesis protein